MAYHGHEGTLETSWEVAQHVDGKQIEYNMSLAHYSALLEDKPKNVDNMKYIMDTVNSTYGLSGTVVKVNVER